MFKRVTHTTITAGLIGVVALLGAGSAIAGSSSHTASIPPCRTPDLSARIVPGSPGAGQRYGTLVLTNRSNRTCHTYGYVGMLLLNRHYGAMATNVVRDSVIRPHRVVLAPGGHATTLLHWAAVQGVGDRTGPCVTPPRYVEITPPDMTTHLTIAWHGGIVCERGQIDVRALSLSH
ncbi:MAG TPA: DUF4232 domain-containing protein [Solirubrobacteraceae bacterium]|nr:DUF4232 domain-containing protein [Solirubrobacteraceae bacterium]